MTGLYEILGDNSYNRWKTAWHKDMHWLAQTHTVVRLDYRSFDAQIISVPPIILKWPQLRFNLGYTLLLTKTDQPRTEQSTV